MNYYVISYNERPKGESGEQCKTEYDLTNACEKCGTGAEINCNLRVRGFSKIRNDFFETIDGDLVISSRLYHIIKNYYNNFELLQVTDSKNKNLDFFHFNSNAILPKFSKYSLGFTIEEQCPICKRNGYFCDAIIGNLETNTPTYIKPLILKYRKKDLMEFKNSIIMKTFECTGLSNKTATGKYLIRYARPLTIVNETIKDVFEKEGIKNVNFDKIMIE